MTWVQIFRAVLSLSLSLPCRRLQYQYILSFLQSCNRDKSVVCEGKVTIGYSNAWLDPKTLKLQEREMPFVVVAWSWSHFVLGRGMWAGQCSFPGWKGGQLSKNSSFLVSHFALHVPFECKQSLFNSSLQEYSSISFQFFYLFGFWVQHFSCSAFVIY